MCETIISMLIQINSEHRSIKTKESNHVLKLATDITYRMRLDILAYVIAFTFLLCSIVLYYCFASQMPNDASEW